MFDAATATPAQIVDSLRQVSLFASRRAIVVHRAEKLLNEQKYPDLAERVAELDEDTLLILRIRDEKASDLDKKPLVKELLKRRAAAYFYAPRKDVEAQTWVRQFAARHRISISDGAARRIIARVGWDTGELAQELRKLAAVTQGEITEAAVDQFLGAYRRDEPPHWADAVIAGESGAFALASRATDQGREAVYAVVMLESRLDVIDRVGRGESVPWFFQKGVEPFIARWPQTRVDAARRVLLKLDRDLKSRSSEGHLARLELATLRLMESGRR